MISHTKIILASFLLLMSTLACVTILGENLPETITPDSIVTNPPATLEEPKPEEALACPVITNQIMKTSTSGSADVKENLLDEEVSLVSYIVSKNEISDPVFEKVDKGLVGEQNDFATHQQVWHYFSALIPEEQRKMLAAYSIMTDGKGGTLAAVSQIESNAHRWGLEVDIADTANYYDLTFTLVHEFGHLLTLGPSQVPPDLAVFNNPDDNDIYLQAVSACPNYFPGEGCANPDSYINSFYNQFWATIHEEWNKINLEKDNKDYYDKLDAFYMKYQDQFVTDYAPTNPEEDIAEAWAFFVLGPKPADNSIADEKVLFFYQYPELVKLRTQILGNLCRVFPQK